MNEKFRVGDKVLYVGDTSQYRNKKFEVVSFYDRTVRCHALDKLPGYDKCRLEETRRTCPQGNWTFVPSNLELAKGYKRKPEDLTRYIVYGQNCDNKSELFKTEEEMTEEAKKSKTHRDWSGRIIGYKLVPMFEVENRVVLKKFKDAKKKKK